MVGWLAFVTCALLGYMLWVCRFFVRLVMDVGTGVENHALSIKLHRSGHDG